MKREEMKEKINAGFMELAPQNRDEIFESIMFRSKARDIVIEEIEEEPPIRFRVAYMMAMACALLICLVWNVNAGNMEYVTIDVNPSVKLTLNAKHQVVKVIGVNDDGKQIVDHIEYEKKERVDKVLEKLVTQIDEDGYMESDAGMLVSIYAKDEVYNDLKNLVETQISEYEKENENSLVLAIVKTSSKKVDSGRKQLEKELSHGDSKTLEDMKEMSMSKLLAKYENDVPGEIIKYERTSEAVTVKTTQRKETVKKTTEKTTQEKETEKIMRSGANSENASSAQTVEEENTSDSKPSSENKPSKDKPSKNSNGNENGNGKGKEHKEKPEKEKHEKKPNPSTTREPNENSTKHEVEKAEEEKEKATCDDDSSSDKNDKDNSGKNK